MQREASSRLEQLPERVCALMACAADEDMVQIGRIALWEAEQSYREDRGASRATYTFAVMRRAIADECVRRGRRQRSADAAGARIREEPWATGEGEGNVDPTQVVMGRMESLALRQLVDTLPRQQRRVIRLRYFEDLSVAETAAKLKIHPVLVVRYTRTALGHLRDCWGRPTGGECEPPDARAFGKWTGFPRLG